jgi:hypothetical protein
MRWRRWLRGLARPIPQEEDALWPRALSGGRSAATALTLVVFVLALTLDDLKLFRFSAAMAGGILAVAVFAFTPPWFATRLVRRAFADAPQAPGTHLENAVLRRRALLGACIAGFLVWLVFFTSGRTPRW